jgi:hypothetical protein
MIKSLVSVFVFRSKRGRPDWGCYFGWQWFTAAKRLESTPRYGLPSACSDGPEPRQLQRCSRLDYAK